MTDVAVQYWRIAKLTRSAGPAVVLAVLGLYLALGLLPVGFIVATSALLGHVAAAASHGGSFGWASLGPSFGAAALTFTAQMTLAPLQDPFRELMARRIDGKIFQRLMAASLAPAGLAFIEDQAVLDDLREASRELEYGFYSPGQACAGLLALVPRYSQLTAYVVVVGLLFSWWAGASLLAVVMAFRHGQRGGLRKYTAIIPILASKRREAYYFREVGTGAPAGKEIRVFGLAGWLSERYQAVSAGWMRPVWAERRRIYGKPFGAYVTAGLLAVGLLLSVLGVSAAHHQLSIKALALVLQAVVAGIRLGDHYPDADSQTQLGMLGYEALRHTERDARRYQAREPQEAKPAPRPAPPIQEIRFDQVTFRYPGRKQPVLDKLSLTIPAGKATALVGLNGAGKTTLIKLLCGLYPPDHGAIGVDGIDIRAFSQRDWRRQIGVIFQDFVRYETTMADNIGFGAVEHLDDRDSIIAAATAAGLDEVVANLTAGLDTPLASHLAGGADLSGGQWQRVALARGLFALAQGASILVLDEPTASLDVRAEARFYDEFMSRTRGATTILISHRFASVRHADCIAVIDEGRVTEQGSHEQLLELGGHYANLFRLQAARFSASSDPAVPSAEVEVTA